LTPLSKGIKERLVVDLLVQVFDEDITLPRLSEGWVTLRPHDTAGTCLDGLVVEVPQGIFSVLGGVKIDVSITERTTSDGVPADANRSDRADLIEYLKQIGLGDIGIEIADVERCRIVVG